jgi:hypothetical protein
MGFLAAVSLTVYSVEPTKVEPVKVSDQQVRSALQMVNSLTYVQDPKSGICFAYSWGGMANGGPALTTVPCETVKNLLVK